MCKEGKARGKRGRNQKTAASQAGASGKNKGKGSCLAPEGGGQLGLDTQRGEGITGRLATHTIELLTLCDADPALPIYLSQPQPFPKACLQQTHPNRPSPGLLETHTYSPKNAPCTLTTVFSTRRDTLRAESTQFKDGRKGVSDLPLPQSPWCFSLVSRSTSKSTWSRYRVMSLSVKKRVMSSRRNNCAMTKSKNGSR